MLLVGVERHDAEEVGCGELHHVRHRDARVLLGDEAGEDLAQLLEDLGVALVQRLVEDDEVIAGGGRGGGSMVRSPLSLLCFSLCRPVQADGGWRAVCYGAPTSEREKGREGRRAPWP